ncbi:MAG: polysaccharide export protein, partial [Planctomycetes bacterium]|nr:polysaccharide export protein [Planctomycetota bacterium]
MLLLGSAGCLSWKSGTIAPAQLPEELQARAPQTLTSFHLSALGGPMPSQYRFQPGDLLDVTISDLVSENQPYTVPARVQEDGTIRLPLVGQVAVNSLTEQESERVILASYSGGGFLKKPQILVALRQPRKVRVCVLGAVTKPGEYELTGADSDLLSALAAAGGLTPNAGRMIEIRHRALGGVGPSPWPENLPSGQPALVSRGQMENAAEPRFDVVPPPPVPAQTGQEAKPGDKTTPPVVPSPPSSGKKDNEAHEAQPPHPQPLSPEYRGEGRTDGSFSPAAGVRGDPGAPPPKASAASDFPSFPSPPYSGRLLKKSWFGWRWASCVRFAERRIRTYANDIDFFSSLSGERGERGSLGTAPSIPGITPGGWQGPPGRGADGWEGILSRTGSQGAVEQRGSSLQGFSLSLRIGPFRQGRHFSSGRDLFRQGQFFHGRHLGRRRRHSRPAEILGATLACLGGIGRGSHRLQRGRRRYQIPLAVATFLGRPGPAAKTGEPILGGVVALRVLREKPPITGGRDGRRLSVAAPLQVILIAGFKTLFIGVGVFLVGIRLDEVGPRLTGQVVVAFQQRQVGGQLAGFVDRITGRLDQERTTRAPETKPQDQEVFSELHDLSSGSETARVEDGTTRGILLVISIGINGS